jgi:hypothetical protein
VRAFGRCPLDLHGEVLVERERKLDLRETFNERRALLSLTRDDERRLGRCEALRADGDANAA